jgi:hypothetical protein
MADTPALAPEYGYYQRLLARDQSEAADLIERHIKTEPPRSVRAPRHRDQSFHRIVITCSTPS